MVEPTNLKPFTLSIYPPIRLDLKQLAMSIVYVVNKLKTNNNSKAKHSN